MSISVGDKIPDVKLVKATADGPQPVQSSDYFAGRHVALFSVPGAFTPTCSASHLPGFVEKADELAAKGIDEIACTAVNDAFVLGAWNKAGGSDAITMLADGNGDFAEALGLKWTAAALAWASADSVSRWSSMTALSSRLMSKLPAISKSARPNICSANFDRHCRRH